MKTWPIQDAKARFSEFLGDCVNDGPQLVTKRGVETAVLIPIETWRRMQETAKPTLIDLLLSDLGRGDLLIPERGKAKRRKVEELL